MHIPDSEYSRIYSQVPRLCVSVVVVSSSGVALVKRVEHPQKGKWHLPGGRVNKGEDFIVAARRVVARELGLDIGSKFVLLGVMQNLSELYRVGNSILDMHNVDVIFSVGTNETEFHSGEGEGTPAWFKRVPPMEECHPTHREFLIDRGVLS
jgi:ADP-ribose pyrophosphatase YjhB (NUDIX family)